MGMKKYRTFIREAKRDVNKLTVSNSYDKHFEDKVNLYLSDNITQDEFNNYLDNELYLNINESFLITESLASKFADSVKSKVKSIFNNLYSKIKETKGFEMIISFFSKVSSGFSKFSSFLKKIKAGKLLRKLLITLGITSLASYILTQFGAGWVALMGGRMAANLVGKKVSDKVVKERLNNLMLYEEFILDNEYKEINKENLDKINDFYKKNYKIIDSYYEYVFKNVGDVSLYNEFKSRFKILKDNINKKYETSPFVEFINWFSNNKTLKRKDKIKSIETASERWKKSNQNQTSIVDEFESIIGLKFTDSDSDKNTKKELDKKDNNKIKPDGSITGTTNQVGNNKRSNNKGSNNKGSNNKKADNKKTSIWSKIGSSISKLFKILRKLKWAVVIFFGVMFILNLIFSPIFEPILAIANVSSLGMILSDEFEETANAIGSIPKVTTDDVDIKVNITSDLPGDSEVTKNIQGAINDVKDNISDNPEEATNEVTDLANNMKNIALYDTEELESIKDIWDDIPDTFEVESKDVSSVERLADQKASSNIANFLSGNSVSGGPNSVYEYTKLYDEKSGIYKIIAVKRDSIGDKVSDEKWNQVLGKSDVLNITDGNKYVKSLEKEGWNFQSSKGKIIDDINDKGLNFQISDIKATGNIQSVSQSEFLQRLYLSDEWNDLPKNIKRNPDMYLIWSKDGDQYTYKMLIPTGEDTEEVVVQAGDKLSDFWNSLDNSVKSKIGEISDNFEKDFMSNSPGDDPYELALVKSLESGKLSIEDLDKIENLNTDDFYSSTSSIRQNAMMSLNNKLSQSGVKVDQNLIILKELNNGSIRAYYLIPKK